MRSAFFLADRETGARRHRRRYRCHETCCRDRGDDVSLCDVLPGASCRICRLHGGGPVRQRLLDLGFQPGREVTVVRSAPLNDPIELRLGESFIVLRRREAAHVEVAHG